MLESPILPSLQDNETVNENNFEKSSKETNPPHSPPPPPPPVYTRRLIPMKYIPAEEIDENFDEQTWFKKLYGPDIIVVSTFGLPEGWILVDGDNFL